MAVYISGSSGIQNPLGSASIPAESNTTNSNTGAYFPTGTTYGIATNGSNAMYIDASQNVGIGTSSPGAKLHVKAGNGGQLQLDNDGSQFTTAIWSNNGTGKYYQYWDQTNTLFVNNMTPAGTFTWVSNSTERMRIDSSGNLLVGTSSGGSPLTVRATTNVVVADLYSSGSSSANPAMYLRKSTNDSTTAQTFIQFLINTGGTGSGQINANGASAAAFGSYSDERLKENIVNLPPQLANICALRPVEFDYKDGSGHQIGFIAQEMQQVYPDVVGVGTDDMLTVTGWSKTEARLVAAIQEQQKLIQELSAEVTALKAKVGA